MFNNTFLKSCHLWDNVERYNGATQATDGNTAHALCMLDNYGYRHTLRICNNYCFSPAIMVAQTHLNVTFILTLPVLLMSILHNTRIYGTSVFQHAIITVELGRNDLGLCETSDNTLYT
jgi:hypothetical protein